MDVDTLVLVLVLVLVVLVETSPSVFLGTQGRMEWVCCIMIGIQRYKVGLT